MCLKGPERSFLLPFRNKIVLLSKVKGDKSFITNMQTEWELFSCGHKKIRLYNIYCLVFLTVRFPLIIKRMKGNAIFVSIIWVIILTQWKKDSISKRVVGLFWPVFNSLALLLWHLHFLAFQQAALLLNTPVKDLPSSRWLTAMSDRW